MFSDAPIIDCYTRAQALEDGTLVDVSEMAREAGFKCPVAVTRALWVTINDKIPPRFQGIQDWKGRLWDVLWMLKLAARRGGCDLQYKLIMHHGRKTYAVLRAVSGPGDDHEQVITIGWPQDF